MPYTYQFINRLDQFGQVSYDLLLDDSDNVYPSHRIGISIDCPDDNEDSLASLAADKIAQAVSDYDAQQGGS
jgi:hypothetical protein